MNLIINQSLILALSYYSSGCVSSFITSSTHPQSHVSYFYSYSSLRSSTALHAVDTYSHALGGILKRIQMENEEDGFVASVSVPTFAAIPTLLHPETSRFMEYNQHHHHHHQQQIKSMEDVELLCIPGAFQIHNVSPIHTCEEIIRVCEESLQFHTYSSIHHTSIKNNHGALQVLVSQDIAQTLANKIQPMVMNQWKQYISFLYSSSSTGRQIDPDLLHYKMIGINRRWRIYRYQPGVQECFLPHIDAAFPPSGLSTDEQTMIWDVSMIDDPYKDYSNVVSRLTLLLYLNEDFDGGYTNFFLPWAEDRNTNKEYPSSLQIVASVQPKAGSVLLFPQAVGEEEVEYARLHWPLHEGSPVTSGKRGKYVIRSDVLFAKDRDV